jgi:hypothetical protein
MTLREFILPNSLNVTDSSYRVSDHEHGRDFTLGIPRKYVPRLHTRNNIYRR